MRPFFNAKLTKRVVDGATRDRAGTSSGMPSSRVSRSASPKAAQRLTSSGIGLAASDEVPQSASSCWAGMGRLRRMRHAPAPRPFSAVAGGQDPAKERTRTGDAITVAGLVDLFIEEHVKIKRKARTAKGYAAVLRSHFLPRFGKRAAERISGAEIGQLHLSLRDSPYQANRMIAIIASMYSFAVKRELVPKGTNPVEGVERFRETSRERYLTIDELNRLGETLRIAETSGLSWKAQSDKPPSKHPAPCSATRRRR